MELGSTFARPWGAPPPLAADARRSRERVAAGRSGVRPRAGLAAAYRGWLLRVIEEMGASVSYFVDRAYRGQRGKIAMMSGLAEDASAATELDRVLRRLRRRWEHRFDELAQDLADFFSRDALRRTDEQLMRILRRGGMAVEFRLTPAVREVLAAIVRENVSLIRSIPEQYLGGVEGAVMRSVTAGRDLAGLTRELRHTYGVTRRRAELISLDQNQKATGAITRARYLDLGIERAVWRHSHAGREPRPTHLANDGHEYDVARGWFDPDPRVRAYIRPGELINCRCFSQPVI